MSPSRPNSQLLLLLCSWAWLSSFGCLEQTQAQDWFRLQAPGTNIESNARLTANELVVRDQAGAVTVYSRLRRYDTPDGQFISYGSREAQRVIQWPSSNRGNMRIGTLRNGQIEFAPSRMSVLPLENPAAIPGGIDGWGQAPNLDGASFPEGAQATGNTPMVLLATGDVGSRQFMRAGGTSSLQMVPLANDQQAAWMITPVGGDMVRLQQSIGNQWYAVGVDPQLQGGLGNGVLAQRGQRSQIRFSAVNNSIGQLWRIQQQGGGGYCFESVAMPGWGMSCLPNQGLWLMPIQYSPWQIWYPQQPSFVVPAPQYRVVSEQVVPNAPLPPVSLRIANTHSDGLLVLLADRRNPGAPRKLRIPEGGSETVVLERDSGGTIVQTVEVVDGFGNWDRREVQIPVPPTVLYDVSIYEEFLQSIAIDATGKSPNVIEDINYQPRSVGFILLPAGDQLQDNSVIDVYRAAADSQNPGAVRRLAPSDYPKSSSQAPVRDPLKDLLQQLQGKRGAF